jgi:hypothetical protein
MSVAFLDAAGNPAGISQTFALPDLANKRTSFAYLPATPNDITLVTQYGSIWKTPRELSHLIPVLYLDGAPVGVGNLPLRLGDAQQIRVSFEEPGFHFDPVIHTVTAGTFWSDRSRTRTRQLR